MKHLLEKLDQYFFTKAPAERLALLRIATGLFSLWYLSGRIDMFCEVAASDLSLFQPVGLARFLDGPVPASLFEGFLWLTLGLNLAFTLGWKFKWTGPAFALALLSLLSYRYSWSMIYHDTIALTLHVLVLGFSKAADALSLDRVFFRKKNNAVKPEKHWRYGWPVQLICIVTVLTYFLSGLAKVYSPLSWEWALGDTLRQQVAVDALRKEVLGADVSPFFAWIYEHSWLFLCMGILTFLIELGAPLALLHRRVGMLWAVMSWAMHWGIYFVMGITFRHQMSGIIFLPFFEIEKLMTFWRNRFKQKIPAPGFP
jgi:hypothetical protein